MMDAITQLHVLASTRQIREQSIQRGFDQSLLQQLTYEDLVQFAHEVGNALVAEYPGWKRIKLRDMYQRIADEHFARLNNGRELTLC
jgi:hypothetical protein